MWKQFKREWALWRDRFTICPLHIRAILLNFPAYVWGWGKVTSKLLISSRCDWPKTISARTSTRWEGLNYKEAKALCSTPAAAAAASILWKIEVNQKIYEFRFAACSQLFPWLRPSRVQCLCAPLIQSHADCCANISGDADAGSNSNT